MAIRVGFVGAGTNTRQMHIPGFQAIEGVELVGVANRSVESSKAVADKFGIPRSYTHWGELVEDPEVDAVCIGTWPYMHHPVTLAALEAGKHVLCEARMAMDAREAREMLEASRARPELVTQIVPSPITFAVDAVVAEAVADGTLGELLAVEVRHTGAHIDREAAVTWREDETLSGTNTLTLGIWYEAIMRWVGEAEWVIAAGERFVKRRRDGEGRMRTPRVPDHLSVIAGLACGAQLTMTFSDVIGPSEPGGAVLYGSEAALQVPKSGDAVFLRRRGESEFQRMEIPAKKRGRWRVEEEFIGAIRGREPVRLTDFATGLKYMEFTEAVWRSRAEGRRVELPQA